MKASSKVPLATIATFDDKPNTSSSKSDMTSLQDYYTKNARTSLVLSITKTDQPLLSVEKVHSLRTLAISRDTVEQKNPKQHDDKTLWLVPDLCYLYCVSASVYRTMDAIPSAIKYIEAHFQKMDNRGEL